MSPSLPRGRSRLTRNRRHSHQPHYQSCNLRLLLMIAICNCPATEEDNIPLQTHLATISAQLETLRPSPPAFFWSPSRSFPPNGQSTSAQSDPPEQRALTLYRYCPTVYLTTYFRQYLAATIPDVGDSWPGDPGLTKAQTSATQEYPGECHIPPNTLISIFTCQCGTLRRLRVNPALDMATRLQRCTNITVCGPIMGNSKHYIQIWSLNWIGNAFVHL